MTNHSIFPVSAMGLCSSVGLGLALGLPRRRVLVLDGDGSILMNLNHFVTMATHPARNLVHLIFDNESYESSGVYPTNTASKNVSLAEIARGSGIKSSSEVRSLDAFEQAYRATLDKEGPFVIVAKVDVIPGFPRGVPNPEPVMDPIEYAIQFSRYIESSEKIRVRKSPRDVFSGLRW
jgi:thiamine pyrophosphate-dependent acetolactate synthase large subunit-like protein